MFYLLKVFIHDINNKPGEPRYLDGFIGHDKTGYEFRVVEDMEYMIIHDDPFLLSKIGYLLTCDEYCDGSGPVFLGFQLIPIENKEKDQYNNLGRNILNDLLGKCSDSIGVYIVCRSS